MVKLAAFSCLCVLLAAPAHSITPDELRALNADTQRDKRARDNRIKTDDLQNVLPAEKEKAEGAPRSNKYGTSPTRPERRSANVPKASQQGAVSASDDSANSNEYIPPPRDAPAKAFITDAVARDTKRIFGIRLGAIVPVELRRNVSSAEVGLAELVVTSDVHGDKKTLPMGTILFGDKQYNRATKRLELQIQKGITPAGLEFKMRGLIFDPQRVAGLTGIVSGESDEMVTRGVGKGLLNASALAAKGLGATAGPLGNAGGAAAESIIQDAGKVHERSTEQVITIYVAPQPALVRVEETF